MFQTVLYGWCMGIEKGEEEIHYGAHIRVPRVRAVRAQVCVATVLVHCVWCVLLAITGTAAVGVDGGSCHAHGHVVYLGMFVFLALLSHIACRRWEREGRL